MKNGKKCLALGLALVMCLALAACGGAASSAAPAASTAAPAASTAAPAAGSEAAPEDAAMKVAVVFASSGLGDKSFNDSLMIGMEEAVTELGITFDYSVPKDDAEYEPLLRGYSDAGDYGLIISLGFSQGTSLENVAPNYPDQNYVLLDATIDVPNVACYVWRDYELAFLVGVVGGMLTESNTMGFIGAHDIPLCNYGAAGMIAGGRYVNPDVEVLVDYAGGWAEVAGCKEITLAMNSQGADVFYHTASAGGMGILEAGKEGGFYTIAFDGNLNADAPETNIASAIRSFPLAAKTAIKNVQDGTFTGGIFEQGISDGALFLDFEGSTFAMPTEIMDAYNKAIEDIASGKIVVPDTVDAARSWQPPAA